MKDEIVKDRLINIRNDTNLIDLLSFDVDKLERFEKILDRYFPELKFIWE